jgi:RimJ/RimL family protein N-acetyltransferase
VPLASALAPGVRKLRQLNVSVRQRGLRKTLYWAAFGYLKPNRFCIFAKRLPDDDTVALAPGATYEVWDAARVAAWRRGRRDMPPELFQDAIDGVRACSVALVDGDIAAFIWIFRPGDVSRLFDLRKGESEVNYGAVLEPYQRHGLFRGVLRCAATWLAERGHHTVYASVHVTNTRSLRAFAACGFTPAGTVGHFGFYRPKYRATGAA